MTGHIPTTFEDLAASRRYWIDTVLRPWCREATRKQLQQADREWLDIAGRADSHATLWTWAWERFPALVHDDLPGVNETHAVTVTLKDGRTVAGFPDGRSSVTGQLVLVSMRPAEADDTGPFSIDDIDEVAKA